MKHISKQKKEDVLSLISKGDSNRKIAKKISLSNATISRIRNSVNSPTHSSTSMGRPKKLTQQDSRELVRFVTSGVCENAVQATSQLQKTAGVTVSTQTV